MEKLSARKRSAIVGDYLSALSYSEIAAKHHVSTGAVANVVTDLRAGRFPEAGDVGEQIEQLKELSLDLKQANLSPGKCAVGLMVLARINECGLDPADIDRWPAILKAAGSEENAKEFIELVYRIQEAQKKTGLTLEEADEKLHELEMEATELEPALKQLEDSRHEIEGLIKTRDKLTPIVNNLEQKYSLLNPRVKDLEERERGLLQRIKQEEERTKEAETTLSRLSKEKQNLQKVGFSFEALAEFGDRVRAIATRHHIAAAGLRDRLLHELECLNEGLGLEALIQGRQAELQKHQQAIASAQEERESLKATIVDLKQQKGALEASIKATRERVSEEIGMILPVAKKMVSQFAGELQHGNDEVLEVMRRLKDQALEIGKEVGRYEGIVETNQWLVELFSLAQSEESLEAKRVRAILLLVLRGAQPWMKHNQAKVGHVTLPHATARLIEELEQWQT